LNRIRYACVTCGGTIETDDVVYECPSCAGTGGAGAGTDAGGHPRGYLAVETEPRTRVRRGKPVDPLDLLPLPVTGRACFPAGGTPLVEPGRLRAATGFPRLFLKDDTLNPSGSLKDRASILVAEQALARAERRVALASTGNAGASMSCAGAAYGLEVVLFVPAAAPRAKLLQSLLYGARVVPVRGTYDDAYDLSIQYTRARGGINRNTAFNPLTVEGKKTVAIELYNQLGCRIPDVVYVPTGDGVIFSGACKGFADLAAAGCADRAPLMVAVQAAGSNAIHRSWREGRGVVLAGAATIADSLSVSRPAAGAMALRFLRELGGRTVEVSDGEIGDAQARLARDAGLFVEPSSAAAWAGFLKDRENVDPGASVVVLLTGTGFKDIAAAERLAAMPSACPARLEEALRFLADVYGMRDR
jgi:threonine synthase